jgi:hypothetical protein
MNCGAREQDSRRAGDAASSCCGVGLRNQAMD